MNPAFSAAALIASFGNFRVGPRLIARRNAMYVGMAPILPDHPARDAYPVAMTQTPPGWYPDPGAPPGVAPHVRYWDGQRWTPHVQPVQARPQRAGPAGVRRGTGAAAEPGPTTADGERLSGWWWRVLASLLDGVFLSIAANVASLPFQIDIPARPRRA